MLKREIAKSERAESKQWRAEAVSGKHDQL